MEYGQFCPIAKASEVIGEKWTILIIRELLIGATRFNELQRALSLISPTLLSKRLDSLELDGLIVKKKIQGQKGYEYFPTQSCHELMPTILSIGEWGMKWTISNLTHKDYDVELLMLYLMRSIQPQNLPGNNTVIRFKFTNVETFPEWWILVDKDNVDFCTHDPGKDVDIYFTSTIETLTEIWMGRGSYKKAVREGDLKLVGDTNLTNNVTSWMANSVFAGLPAASEI
ncbi:MAG: winged helix-turn-helix transcriptional regulator [Gammaproteobacteria bacterium]|nr:winged helix-turn-helix transcriptional regulator [Gammaproteobacteria bacterium]